MDSSDQGYGAGGRLDDAALDLILRGARAHLAWRDEPVADATLRELYDLMKMGPTSANCSPARLVFVSSPAAKQRLLPALSKANAEKTLVAPVTAIIAYDTQFYEHLPFLFHNPTARSWFAGNERLATETAFRNGTLQGAYLIIAARALGLDTGPMSGFDNAKVDAEFFAGTNFKSNFICSLGRGDPSVLPPRAPRFAFEQVCQII
jgi:3-hydroxypropanoate dehydrogenase